MARERCHDSVPGQLMEEFGCCEGRVRRVGRVFFFVFAGSDIILFKAARKSAAKARLFILDHCDDELRPSLLG